MNQHQSPLLQKVWMLSREYGGLAGAGGVKDAVRQLAESCARIPGFDVRAVIPLYGFIRPEDHGLTPLMDPLSPELRLDFEVDMNYGMEERRERCRIWTGKLEGVTLYLVESQRFSEKAGVYTYADSDSGLETWRKPGMGHYDYFAMNVLLQKGSLELMLLLGEKPDVIHCHDGHTALVPSFIHELQGWRSYFRDTGCLVTIHNAGVGYHQEIADLPFAHSLTGLSWRSINENRLSGKFDPFLASGEYAIMNTVSENYARELQETEEDRSTDWLGHVLLERGIVLEGITNGICPEFFSPVGGGEAGLAAAFDPADSRDKLNGKRVCKDHLLKLLAEQPVCDGAEVFGSLEKDGMQPLFAFIGRLNEQKGVDHFLEAIEHLFSVHDHGQAVMLGNGSEIMEATIRSLAAKKHMKGRLCYLRGFSPDLANRIYAAGDFFVIPSRYEPCGLTDYIAQLFGTVPVVHHVGGLVKVLDGETGIAYRGGSAVALFHALERALRLYEDKKALRRMQRRAVEIIREKYTWDVVRQRYVELYCMAKNQRALTRDQSGSAKGSVERG